LQNPSPSIILNEKMEGNMNGILKKVLPVCLIFIVGLFFMNSSAQESLKTFALKSTAFEDGEAIPVKYTCDGENMSPALQWKNAPEKTQSFALICDDPDAPSGTWVHWVIFNIPAQVSQFSAGFEENEANSDELKQIVQGKNSWNENDYGGPCPPKGSAHRYFFKLYALDSTIEAAGLSKADLLKKMAGHILAEAQLMGTYIRAK
jgi:Raf kinase inhibitor-like YbhB/YbcL family protein